MSLNSMIDDLNRVAGPQLEKLGLRAVANRARDSREDHTIEFFDSLDRKHAAHIQVSSYDASWKNAVLVIIVPEIADIPGTDFKCVTSAFRFIPTTGNKQENIIRNMMSDIVRNNYPEPVDSLEGSTVTDFRFPELAEFLSSRFGGDLKFSQTASTGPIDKIAVLAEDGDEIASLRLNEYNIVYTVAGNHVDTFVGLKSFTEFAQSSRENPSRNLSR